MTDLQLTEALAVYMEGGAMEETAALISKAIDECYGNGTDAAKHYQKVLSKVLAGMGNDTTAWTYSNVDPHDHHTWNMFYNGKFVGKHYLNEDQVKVIVDALNATTTPIETIS